MSSYTIEINGTSLKIRIPENEEFVTHAVQETEQFIETIRDVTKLTEQNKVLLVALLNRTMELEKMKQNGLTGISGDQKTAEWARELTSEIQEVLVRV